MTTGSAESETSLSRLDEFILEISKCTNEKEYKIDESFFDMCIGDMRDLKEFLHRFPDSPERKKILQMLLHRAMRMSGTDESRRKVVDILLENGADPNHVDDVEKVSPFMYDAFNGKHCIECFLKWYEKTGLTLNANGLNTNTNMTVVMHLAAAPRTPHDSAAIDILAKDPANLVKDPKQRDLFNKENELGRNALFFAVVSNYQNKATKDVVDSLIKAGIDVNHTDVYGQNVAHYVASNAKVEADILDTIFKDKKDEVVNEILGQQDTDMNTPAHLAGEAQNIPAFIKIKTLSKEIERNLRDETALMCLCRNLKNPILLNHALEKLKLDPEKEEDSKYLNAVDDNGNTALHYLMLSMTALNCSEHAIRYGVKSLISHGVNDESAIANQHGLSYLDYCVFLENGGILRYLMGRGVDVKIQSP